MATIKSYTDLEQSKKLAEILPLESADMYYFDDNGGEPNFKVRNGITYYYDCEDCLCCWSLAALLEIIPSGQVNRMANSDKWEASSWNDSDFEPALYVEDYDNPVDACVAMIKKLHELNLL